MEYDRDFLSLYARLFWDTRIISEMPETDGKFIIRENVYFINAFRPWR